LDQIYFIWHEKKEGTLRKVIGFMKKKMNLGVLRLNHYVSNGIPQPYLDPKLKYNMINNDKMEWPLPPMQNVPTTSFPKCLIFCCVHQGSDAQQKHTIPLYFTSRFLFLSSLLPFCLPLFYACLNCPFLLPLSCLLLLLNNNRTWFKVELTLKVVKSSLPTLIPNDCLPMYI